MLIPSHDKLSLFNIEFVTGVSKFQSVSSSEARKITFTKTVESDGEIIVIDFEGIGKLDVNAKVTVATGGGGQMMCPLYSFLYHEYLNGHSGFYTNSVNDEALRASVARALVAGYFLNFTLRDKGLIEYDWDQLWTRAIPDQNGILDWARRATKFRNDIGYDYLIFGRMLQPWIVTNVTMRDFGYGKEPLVQSATWKTPDGRIGVVLANYANSDQLPGVELEVEGKKKITLHNDDQVQSFGVVLPTKIDFKMSPRTLCLIEIR